jgi:SpoIID/LytB domain protein
VSAAAPLNPAINVGIVQRFGEKPDQKIQIQALQGDQLTLAFQDQGRTARLQTPTVTLTIQPQPLSTPQVQERVVLSIHRSFESAETSANEWRQKGIAVEVAQPNRWQVWGNRQRYNTPELRQQLLSQLQSEGLKTAYLDQQTLTQIPRVQWVVNGQTFSAERLEIRANQGQLDVNQERFAGQFRLQPNTYGTFTLVNQVPVETYLRGVVPYEIGPNAPTLAVQAQAIIARTYALRNLRRFEIDGYQLCADTQCQVYRGITGSSPRVDQAIKSTQGQVLTYKNELVDALYSSTTGGVTARFEDVWEGAPRPYLTAIIDAVPNRVWDLQRRSLSNEQSFRQFIQLKQGFNEQTWRYFRWQTTGSLTDLNKELREFLKQKQSPLANFQTIESIQVLARANSGRVQQLKVVTNLGEVLLQKDEILRCFYAPNSLLFYLDPKRDPTNNTLVGYTFTGGGLGHAVGLSQTGSYRLADLGWSPSRILQFYYPGTRLEPLNASVIFWQDPMALQAGLDAELTSPWSIPFISHLWEWLVGKS